MRRGARDRLGISLLVVSSAGLLGFIVLAVIGPVVWGNGADALGGISLAHPSRAHLLGTDSLGRDVLARTLVATRLTLIMAVLSTAIASGGGVLVGASIAISGSRVQAAGNRVIDGFVAFPPIILALTITAILQPSVTSVVVAIGISFAPQFARLSSTVASSIAGRDYIHITRLLGVRPAALLVRHVVPNAATSLTVLTSVGFASAIVTLSSLSFIGLGVQSPQYDWGELLSEGLSNLYVSPAQALGPAVAITLAGLFAGMLGEAVTRLSNPRVAVSRGFRGLVNPMEPHAAVGVGAAGDETVAAAYNLSVLDPAGVSLVNSVSLTIGRGERVGLVGESGSGKTLTAMAMAGLTPEMLLTRADSLSAAGIDLLRIGGSQDKRTLATKIGVIFQDPSTSFNPALRMGTQLTEVLRVHGGVPRGRAREMAVERLREVQVSSPRLRLAQYPHELSGGMRQRSMIAMALLTDCQLLVADEPTTALDVTVQAGVLNILREVNEKHGTAIFLISHDISVISNVCERVLVMYAGHIVEDMPVEALRSGQALHPYARALVGATPSVRRSDSEAALVSIPGRPPQAGAHIEGCPFAPRCGLAMDICRAAEPLLKAHARGHLVACHAVGESSKLSGSEVQPANE